MVAGASSDFVIFAGRRSGNHLVIFDILDSCGDNVDFINNDSEDGSGICLKGGEILFDDHFFCSPSTVFSGRPILQEQTGSRRLAYSLLEGKLVELQQKTNKPVRRFKVSSYENTKLASHDTKFSSPHLKKVIVIRRPERQLVNDYVLSCCWGWCVLKRGMPSIFFCEWLATQVCLTFGHVGVTDSKKCWLEHAHQFSGGDYGRSSTKILFDRYLIDPAYRKEKRSELGLFNCDEAFFSWISPYGGGSTDAMWQGAPEQLRTAIEAHMAWLGNRYWVDENIRSKWKEVCYNEGFSCPSNSSQKISANKSLNVWTYFIHCWERLVGICAYALVHKLIFGCFK